MYIYTYTDTAQTQPHGSRGHSNTDKAQNTATATVTAEHCNTLHPTATQGEKGLTGAVLVDTAKATARATVTATTKTAAPDTQTHRHIDTQQNSMPNTATNCTTLQRTATHCDSFVENDLQLRESYESSPPSSSPSHSFSLSPSSSLSPPD